MAEKYIKVNIPLTEENYLSGNGEGVWVEVDESTRAAYDSDARGGIYHGILANDSLYYPGLGCGDVVEFEMRGEHRPVVRFDFLEGRPRLTEADKDAIIRKMVGDHPGKI